MPTEDLVRSHRRTEAAAREPRLRPTEEREHLVPGNLPLVRLIAHKVHDRLPKLAGVGAEDLVYAGIVGLTSAAQRQI
jgi:DNA-directed RNA polymerase specialized sigma subunit